MITFKAELNSLEAASSSTPILEALSPYINDIYQIIDRLTDKREQVVTLPTLSLRSLYQENNTIKLLELDRLVLGHPALH